MEAMMRITAIILAGGRGTRMAPYDGPKCLVPIRNRPLLTYLIDSLASGGIEQVIVCGGYAGEVLQDYIERTVWPLRVDYSFAGEQASMSERLIVAAKQTKGHTLVCYGDEYAEVDIAGLTGQHEKAKALVTMTVIQPRSPFGVVRWRADGRVENIDEKPILPEWVSIGYMLAERKAYDLLNSDDENLVPWLNRLACLSQLYAFAHTGRRLTVNTLKERDEAEQMMWDNI